MASLTGRPLWFTTKRNIDSATPVMLEMLARVTMKMFTPGPDGLPRMKGEFDAQGFRKTSYAELANLLGVSERTVARHVKTFKDSGYLDTRQVIAEDGKRCESWWIRPNPEVLQAHAEKIKEARVARKRKPNDRTVVVSPSLSEVAVATVAIAPSEEVCPEKEKMNSEEEVHSKTEEPTPETFQERVGQVIMETEVGEVLKVISAVFPEKPTYKQLTELHRLAYRPNPDHRLDRKKAEKLMQLMEQDPELLGNFSKLDSEKHGLDVLIKFWPAICKRVVGAQFREYAMQQADVELLADSLQQGLTEKTEVFELRDLANSPHKGPYWVQCLILALKHKWSAKAVEVTADKARAYLMQSPMTYAAVRKHFPQIIRLCRIPEPIHNQLLREATEKYAKLNGWNAVKFQYGFD